MKTIYYNDELNDDFASTQGIKTKPLPENYKWMHTGVIWKLFSRRVILSHCISTGKNF